MRTDTPIVELRGPWLKNNGDALGLWAVVEHFAGRATIAVSSTLGLDALPPEPPLPIVKWPPDASSVAAALRSPSRLPDVVKGAAAAMLAPRSLLRARGLVRGSDVSALLDCSGFAYGDAWPIWRTRERAAYDRRLGRRGVAVILLPQAFGPFEKPEVRDASQRMLRSAQLIFPRDRTSLAHLQSLELGGRVAGVAPDITHLLEGRAPAKPQDWFRRVCIVPNARMIDRTSAACGRRYLEFLLRAVRAVHGRNLDPSLLVHESGDLPLARQVQRASSLEVPIVVEDARTAKGILGSCFGVVGSRYHALISAMSQGVPAIGTSWSHKYEELFSDYGCPELLLSPEDDPAHLEAALRRFLEPSERDAIAARLVPQARLLKERVRAMWGQVEERIPGVAVPDRTESHDGVADRAVRWT